MDDIIKQLDKRPTFLSNVGGILLTTEDEDILNKYQIDYKNCKNARELIFKIEDYLNESYIELDDLDALSIRLSEFNYYHDTNK